MQERNPYEHQHRLLKAVRIVDVLEESNISLNSARDFDKQKQVAVASQVNAGAPSVETWKMVCELYEKRVSANFQ
jgi:cell division FtsZ-interacting protein ZapD